MSANYNTALLRQMQSPLLASLAKIEEQLDELLSGKRPPQQLDVGKEAHEVSSALHLIGREAVARVARAIEAAVRALAEPHRRGWEKPQIDRASAALVTLVRAFALHLQEMNAGEGLHVRLWPLWSDLELAMENPVRPAIEDLFEVDADFQDDHFRPKPVEYLKEFVDGAYSRLTAAVSGMEVARSEAEMEVGLRKALDVFSHVYGLKHRKAYQTYWLILRARLSVGLMEKGTLLANREAWVMLLRETGTQLQKFGKDHRRMPPEKVHALVRPLLKPWPPEWTVAHPILAEVDRRMGLSVFWSAVEEVMAESSEGASAKFTLRKKEIEASLVALRNNWSKAISSPPEQRKAFLVGYLRSLSQVLGKREWLPGTLVKPLFDQLKTAGDRVAEMLKAREISAVPEALAFEVAASILMLEEIVERRARWSQELEARVASQSMRLAMAMDGREVELRKLPALRWDAKWRQRQVDKAVRLAMEQVRTHCEVIEKALSDVVRGEDVQEAVDRMDELSNRAELVGKVMLTLRQPLAGRLAQALAQKIEMLASAAAVPTEYARLAPPMASLSRFVVGFCNGDVEASGALSAGIDALLGAGAYQAMVEELAKDEGMASDTPLESVQFSSPVAQESIDAKPARNLRAELLGAGALDTPRDGEIAAIFLEEATQALEESATARRTLLARPRDEEAWTHLRRQFHTLKGSGRIAGLVALGEVAWWVEERLNEALTLKETYAPALDDALEQASSALAAWYAQVAPGAQLLVQGSALRKALDDAPPYLPMTEISATPQQAGPSSEEAFVWDGGMDALAPGSEAVSVVEAGLGASQEELASLVEEAEAALPGGADEPLDDWPDLPLGDAVEVGAPALMIQAPEDVDTDSLLLPEEGAPTLTSEPKPFVLPAFEGLDEEVSQMIRADAKEKAEEIAAALVRYEMGDGMDLRALHLAAHTLASLAASGKEAGLVALSRAVENKADAQMQAQETVGPALVEAASLLQAQGLAFSQGLALEEVSPDLLAAIEVAEQADLLDEGEWSMSFGEEGATLEATLEEASPEAMLEPALLELEAAPTSVVATPGIDVGEGLPASEAPADAGEGMVESTDMQDATHSELSEPVEAAVIREVVEWAEEAPLPAAVAIPAVLPFEGSHVLVESMSASSEESEDVEMPAVIEPAQPQALSGPVVAATAAERQAYWQEIFEAIDQIQEGFAKLSTALIGLSDLDAASSPPGAGESRD